MAIHLTPEANPTIQEGTLYVDSATGEFNVAGRTTPHIIPGVLYPAVAGKLLDGNTSHSGNYGTAQSDERSYYYTDIKGSKPIKDPRIGGHFGSQRHKFKSLQLLEQETATHGSNVYSVDGREWIRCVNGTNGWNARNDSQGNCIEVNRGNLDGTDFMEITGYFNFANISVFVNLDHQDQTSIFLNGTDTSNDLNVGDSIATPLMGRYVDPGSLVNLNLGTINTPGINTIKLTVSESGSGDMYALFYAIELIAQDITSTANRSKIQIPSQNVVSFGKKFTVSGTPHYDPFNGFTSGSSVTSYIDTATSLGVENWKESSTYYRPYNGMRVIKWVDSSGTIKTSVTVMPPLAKSLADSNNLNPSALSDNITAASANSEYRPYFGQNDAYDAVGKEPHGGLHEVAKTFHWREFGNGSANGGTNSSSYPDASMLNTSDSFAYVMDDGLTSLSANDFSYNSTYGLLRDNVSDKLYLTFIGTGLTWNTYLGVKNWVQNLPYGTHVLEFAVDASDAYAGTLKIDGVTIKTFADSGDNRINYWSPLDDITFHQPKRPPIPEDACVLADYMLMANFVPATVHGYEIISKGVRFLDVSRDLFYNDSSSITLQHFDGNSSTGQTGGFRAFSDGTAKSYKLPVFGSGCAFRYQAYTDRVNNATFKVDGSAYGSSHSEYVSGNRFDVTNTSAWDTSANDGTFDTRYSTNGTNAEERVGIKDLTIGNRVFEASDATSGHFLIISGMEIINPIHTSSHYQTFETPFLHELVGGDRNMEQHNLICSPDGRTWDSLTRDTSYIGNVVCKMATDTATDWSTTVLFDEWRGVNDGRNWFNKYFAIAYDRLICLETGWYKFTAQNYATGSNTYMQWSVSGKGGHTAYATNAGYFVYIETFYCKKGDYIQLKGEYGNDVLAYNNAFVEKLS